MPVYIVTYDFNREISDADRKRTRDAVLKMDAVQLSESTYGVDTPLNAASLFDVVKKSLDANDSLYVLPLDEEGDYRGYHVDEVNAWVGSKLD